MSSYVLRHLNSTDAAHTGPFDSVVGGGPDSSLTFFPNDAGDGFDSFSVVVLFGYFESLTQVLPAKCSGLGFK